MPGGEEGEAGHAGGDPPDEDIGAEAGEQGADEEVGEEEAGGANAADDGIGEGMGPGGGDAEGLGDRADGGHGGADGEGGEEQDELRRDREMAEEEDHRGDGTGDDGQPAGVEAIGERGDGEAGDDADGDAEGGVGADLAGVRPQFSSQSGQKGRWTPVAMKRAA